MSFIADTNSDYKSQEYWEHRFEKEDEYEWLVVFKDVEKQLKSIIKTTDKILIIGCGNSKFSSDLYDSGYHNIINIDYSAVVIHKMKELNQVLRPYMQWLTMDMTDLTFSLESFDIVLDKAAMDAIMVDEGNVWDPEESVINMANKMCQEIQRVLTPAGVYIQISFAQPHFRTKYLMGLWASNSVEEHYKPAVGHSAVYNWTLRFETIPSQKGTFDNFLYIMHK